MRQTLHFRQGEFIKELWDRQEEIIALHGFFGKES